MKILLSGTIGRSGLGGQAWASLQYLLGLRALGHDVYYLEDCGSTSSVWNWDTEEWTQEIDFPAAYVRNSLEPFGFKERWIYRTNTQAAGMSIERLQSLCGEADLLIMRGAPLWEWRSEYDRPTRRIFIDVDPGFTQFRIANKMKGFAEGIRRADRFFTIAQRFNAPDCTVPTEGWEWHKLLPPVVLSEWPFVNNPADTHFTSVMRWQGGFDQVIFEFNGVAYGQKDMEFKQFIELPRLTGQRFRIAINGPDLLLQHGWEVVPGERATRTPLDYWNFIRESRAEFGVARNGYVQSCAGWFSDRSVCYLASGLPVLVQDTGLSDWLPTGRGVVTFRTLDDAVRGVEAINSNYEEHRRAARQIAEDYFSADKVLTKLIDTAMQ
jgi:hypothetical protein